MRKLPSILIHIFASCSILTAQEPTARIENVRMDMRDNYLEIRYDITGSSEGTVHQIDFVVVDNMGNIVTPDSISGDVGTSVLAGNDKLIVWELYKEFDVIYGDFIPQVILDAPGNKKRKGGPEFALLSLVFPGTGDYFVSDWKESKLKPYYKTAFTLGTLALSLAAFELRNNIPAVMYPPGWYYRGSIIEYVPGEWYYVDHWWPYEPARTEYWLFPHDAEVFLGIGLASWLFDVIWVSRKGIQNNRIRSEVLSNLSLAPCKQGMMLSYRVQF